MVKCTVCNNDVDDNAEFCPNCGTKVEQMATANEVENQTVASQNTKFCTNCGDQIDVNAVICPKCGVQIAGTTEEKSPILALILSASAFLASFLLAFSSSFAIFKCLLSALSSIFSISLSNFFFALS